jgi:hypothetical protein
LEEWSLGRSQRVREASGKPGLVVRAGCSCSRRLPPFQLRPQEILELIHISEDMHPDAEVAANEARCENLREHRENVVRPMLLNEAHASRSFCFRNNTAHRLCDILSERIASELSARAQRCLGGEKSMRTLRGRLTRRDGDLIVGDGRGCRELQRAWRRLRLRPLAEPEAADILAG